VYNSSSSSNNNNNKTTTTISQFTTCQPAASTASGQGKNRTHHADPEVSALVTDSATGDLQAGHSGAGAQMR